VVSRNQNTTVVESHTCVGTEAKGPEADPMIFRPSSPTLQCLETSHVIPGFTNHRPPWSGFTTVGETRNR
jgi:hypothetical protein